MTERTGVYYCLRYFLWEKASRITFIDRMQPRHKQILSYLLESGNAEFLG